MGECGLGDSDKERVCAANDAGDEFDITGSLGVKFRNCLFRTNFLLGETAPDGIMVADSPTGVIIGI